MSKKNMIDFCQKYLPEPLGKMVNVTTHSQFNTIVGYHTGKGDKPACKLLVPVIPEGWDVHGFDQKKARSK